VKTLVARCYEGITVKQFYRPVLSVTRFWRGFKECSA